ncbi:MAG TPA: acetyl-CoA carboxylase biotin carboxyl carrier protein [Pyrinomonadaceae bacterium]|nr:acetyl-CoA carboxylase biotin carboxyl carrier protein [Pyrinomonadaceae bacterium]
MNNPEAEKTAEAGQSTEEISVENEAAETGRTRRRRAQAIRTEIPVNIEELRELIQLIREHEFTEFELEREGFRVRFRRGADVQETAAAHSSPSVSRTQTITSSVEPAVASSSVPSHPGAKAQTEASEDQDLHIIPSPIVGTFYRSPSPNADSFVKIGSVVEPDSVVCIIEAMKLMNEIQAETSGEVAKIYVENGQPVEYGQPLFGIKK